MNEALDRHRKHTHYLLPRATQKQSSGRQVRQWKLAGSVFLWANRHPAMQGHAAKQQRSMRDKCWPPAL